MSSGVSSSKVRRNFSRSASSYDSVASVQREAAGILAARAAAALPRERSSILELGCGTGLLSSELLRLAPSASILASDISPEMLKVCGRKLLASGRLQLLELDFCKPLPESLGLFDMIASSFAFQWGACVAGAIESAAQRLKPKGQLCAAVPLAGSLEELHIAFSEAGLGFPGLQLPDEASLLAPLKASFSETSFEIRLFSEGPFPLADALRRFQSLGAVNAGEPMQASSLRQLLRRAGGRPVKLDYRVAFASGRKA